MARTVVRVPHPDRPQGPRLYIKRFKFDGLRRKLKALLGPTQARREWTAGRELLRRGIPTCRVLAAAERRSGLFHEEAFLITEEVQNARPLREHPDGPWAGRLNPGLKGELIGELAGLLARMVRAGVCHADLHVGNVLIVPGRPAGQRLFVLDLHRIRLGKVSRRWLVRMLVFLADSSRRLGISSADRVRFLRALLDSSALSGGTSSGALRRWAQKVKRAWTRHDRRHMRSRTRRCLVESSEFTRDRAAGFTVLRGRCLPLDAALAIVDSHRQAVAGASLAQVHKRGLRTEITRVSHAACGPVYVKAFLRRRFGDRVKDLLRWRGRARAAWIAHQGLRVRGLPAARALALLEATGKLRGQRDYLVTEDVGADGNLHQLSRTRRWSRPERRQLAEAIADLFRLLADRNVRHPDMKPSNILVAGADGGPRLWLVDLDRVRFEAPWRRRHWIHHLSQCNAGLPPSVTVLDRMRCLRRCGLGRWSPAERLDIARAVLRESRSRNPALER